MKLKTVIVLMAICVFTVMSAVLAQESPKTDLPREEMKPMMDLSGVAYFWWQQDINNEAPGPDRADHFTVNRVYLTWAKKFDDVWSVRFTTDVDGSTTGSNKVYFKNAYLQMKQDFDPVVFTVRYELQGTPVLSLIDKVRDGRWIYNNYIDKSADLVDTTFDTTADAGISVDMEIMKMVTLTAMYSNGEGYSKGFNEASDDTSKAYYGMLAVNPLKSLYVAAFYKTIENNDDLTDGTYGSGDYNRFYGAMLAWSDEIVKIGGTYTMPKIKSAGSTFKFAIIDTWLLLNLNSLIGSPVLLYGRFASGEDKDNYAALSGVGSYSTDTWSAGIGYEINKNVRTLVMYETKDNKKARDTDDTVWIKTEAKF